MKFSTGALASAVAMCVVLTGCGGGGGGASDSGNAGEGAKGQDSQQGTSPGGGTGNPDLGDDVVSVPTVYINGAPAAVNSAGQFTIKSGDRVELAAGDATTGWSSSSGTKGAITLLNPAINGAKWSAQLVNTTGTDALYTVTAKPSGAATVFVVAAGDARNGTYSVFAANGTQQSLKLNFNSMRYEMTDDATSNQLGVFEESSDAGTYVFTNARIQTASNTARFRLSQDTVVGAFPFAVAQVTPAGYAVQPFVAARALVTDPAQLGGTYNRFAINLTATSAESQATNVSIANDGATATRCDGGLSPIGWCAPDSRITYAVTTGPTAGTWRLTNQAAPSDVTNFAIARIGEENIYLAAGKQASTPATSSFVVGLPDRWTWAPFTAAGASTNGWWGTTVVNGTSHLRTVTRLDGTQALSPSTLEENVPADSIDGVRKLTLTRSGGQLEDFLAARSNKIHMVLGGAGYMSVALID